MTFGNANVVILLLKKKKKNTFKDTFVVPDVKVKEVLSHSVVSDSL